MIAGWATAIAMIAKAGYDVYQKANKKSEAESSKPPQVDPEMRELQQQIGRRRDAIYAGDDSAPEMRETRQMVSETQDEMVRAGGGDVGTTMTGLLQAQREGQRNINKVIGQNRKYYMGLQKQIQERISQRRMEMQQYDRVQALAQSAQSGKRANMGMQGLIGQAGGLFGGGGDGGGSSSGGGGGASGGGSAGGGGASGGG